MSLVSSINPLAVGNITRAIHALTQNVPKCVVTLILRLGGGHLDVSRLLVYFHHQRRRHGQVLRKDLFNERLKPEKCHMPNHTCRGFQRVALLFQRSDEPHCACECLYGQFASIGGRRLLAQFIERFMQLQDRQVDILASYPHLGGKLLPRLLFGKIVVKLTH